MQTYTISFPEPEDPPVSVPSAAYHYLHDVLGSVIGLVDDAGELVERYTYDPYGKVFIEKWDATANGGVGAWLASAEPTSGLPVSSVGNPFMWTGHRYDAAVGLYATLFRTYSPTLGRWLQRDPIEYEGGSINLYEYVASQPLTAGDRLGLEPMLTTVAVTTAEVAGGASVAGPTLVIGGFFGVLILVDAGPCTDALTCEATRDSLGPKAKPQPEPKPKWHRDPKVKDKFWDCATAKFEFENACKPPPEGCDNMDPSTTPCEDFTNQAEKIRKCMNARQKVIDNCPRWEDDPDGTGHWRQIQDREKSYEKCIDKWIICKEKNNEKVTNKADCPS